MHEIAQFILDHTSQDLAVRTDPAVQSKLKSTSSTTALKRTLTDSALRQAEAALMTAPFHAAGRNEERQYDWARQRFVLLTETDLQKLYAMLEKLDSEQTT